MGYAWSSAADAPPQSDVMPEGYHRAKVVRIFTSTKDGEPLTSKNGSPQVRCFMENADGEEATLTFTLSERAGWALARFLKLAGADVKRMEEAGVGLDDFTRQDFAEKQLVGRESWIEVKHNEGSNGKIYANADAVEPEHVPVSMLAADKGGDDAGRASRVENAIRSASDNSGPHQPVEEDDIPF